MNPAVEEHALVPMTSARRMFATMALMAATILAVLDQTIAAVVLPHMQATLGATPDTVTWVLTSYVLSQAIATPMTGWLTGRFGRTEFFTAMLAVFTIASVACGLSTTLPMMVTARVVQGFSGAFVLPMSQTFLFDMNPPSTQVRAVTIWSAGTTVAPILGPVLGGYLTDTFNWRWVFFINLPIGVIAVIAMLATMPKFPSLKRPFDHLGFAMIVVALGALQLALDRGTQQDWLDSPEIVFELGLSIAFFWMLIFHLRSTAHPIVLTSLFRYRNFSAAMLIGMVVIPVVTAGSALLPPLLQVLLGYSAEYAGVVLIPRAFALALGILLAGRLMRVVDGRVQIFVGMLVLSLSLLLQTRFEFEMGPELVLWAGLLQGLGTSLAMTVVNFLAVGSVPPELRTEGAALYMLVRNIATSILISMSSALLVHNTQLNHAELGARLGPHSMPFSLSRLLGAAPVTEKVAAFANAEVTRQAMMIAYIDDFWLMMWATLAMIPVLLLIRPLRAGRAEMVVLGE
jgi:DHA2 family multidrug resistance protein